MVACVETLSKIDSSAWGKPIDELGEWLNPHVAFGNAPGWLLLACTNSVGAVKSNQNIFLHNQN